MPRSCTVCQHPSRAEIDSLLVEGVSLRDIAGRWGLSKSALDRHKADHLPALLVKAKDAQQELTASRILADLQGLQGKALALLAKAERAGDLRVALAGVREARGCMETAAKLLELSELEERIEKLEQEMEVRR